MQECTLDATGLKSSESRKMAMNYLSFLFFPFCTRNRLTIQDRAPGVIHSILSSATASTQTTLPGLIDARCLDCFPDDTISPSVCAHSDNTQKLLFPLTVVSSSSAPEDHNR